MSERTRSTARGPPVEEPISRHCGLTEPGLGVPGNVEGVEAEGTGARILAGRTRFSPRARSFSTRSRRKSFAAPAARALSGFAR